MDALVNCGNVRAAAAELVPPDTARQLLSQAAEAYSAALQQEEDASVCVVGFPIMVGLLGTF